MSASSGEGAVAARRWKAATLTVLAAGWLLGVALNAPGHLSYDSVIQLLDGRTGRYHTWHPPFMAWLLGLADAVTPGAGLYVAGQSALMFGALGLLVAGAPRPGPAALVVAALICASPLVLVWQGLVWKDVLYADLTVAGFAALAAAARSAMGRIGSTLAAGLLLTGAALTRQDGALALLAGAAVIVAQAWRSSTERPRRRAAAMGLLWLLATGTVAALASLALSARSVDGNGAAAQLSLLQSYDLVGVVARAPAVPLDRVTPALAADIRRAARSEYTPLHNDALLADRRLDAGVGETPESVAAQWRELVAHRPLAWARHRAAVFAQMLFTPDLKACRADFTGVAGPAETLAVLRMAPRNTARDRALWRYAARFHGTPVYAHAAYGLLAAGLAVWLLARGGPGDGAMAGLLLAALAYAGAFLLIGVACDYRYLYPLDLAAMVGALHAAATARCEPGDPAWIRPWPWRASASCPSRLRPG